MAAPEDPFDSVLFLDDNAVKKGHDEGRKVAVKRGEEEGRALGLQKGFEIGSEVGFYHGFAKTYLELEERGDKNIRRAKKQLQQLVVMAENFPQSNPKDEDLVNEVEAMRAKFKHSCSLLKIDCEFGSAAKTISW